MRRMIGKTIGNYQITDRLGAGGMGEVFRARDTKLDRDVAIKMLPEGVAADAERLARFEREAKVLAGLNHPNIAAIYGVEEAGGATYLVLELVEGEDLSKRLDGGPVALDDAMEIARQIAEALEAAHEQGVIHRDLKPANVVLTPEGKPKVLDFGLAKALDTQSSSAAHNLSNSPTVMASSPTLAGVILGTAAYMSPEQARGKVVDRRADIFAFGAVFWEMLTGRQLFVGETVSDTLAAVLRHEPDFDELPAEAHPALRRLLERCLDKDPRTRLRDIGEARITLGDIASGKADAPAAGDAESKPGFFRQYGGWIATAVVVTASLIMMSTMKAPQSSSDSGGASIPLRKSMIPLDQDDPSVVSGFKARISPDGRYLVYPRQGQLWVRDLTSTQDHPVTGTDGAAKPFWSPDGTEIGFGDGQLLYRIAREGGQRVTIGSFPTGVRMDGAAAAAWTPDGRIVIGSSTEGLFEVEARGGTIREVLVPGENETDFHEVCALPDGKGWAIIVHTSTGIGNIDAVSPGYERLPLLRLEDNVSDVAWSNSGHLLFQRSGSTPGIWALPVSLDPIAATGEPFLVVAGAQSPSLSPDGTLVYTQGIGNVLKQITIVDKEGDLVKTIGEPFPTGRPFPAFSPSGRSIMIAENVGETREIFNYDVASGNRRRITFDDRRDDMVTYFVSDQEIITYESNSYTTQRVVLDGSAEPGLFDQTLMMVLTDDDKTAVFVRPRKDEWAFDIMTQPADGSGTPVPLVQSDGVDWWPQISPDGNYLLYMSDESGREDVYMTTLPNPVTRWEVSSDGGAWPRWGPDGSEIYYAVENRLMAVSVSHDAGITLGTPRKLFNVNRVFWSSRWPDGFDVSPDGQHFAVLSPVRSESDAPPSVVVVQNWWAEFEE